MPLPPQFTKYTTASPVLVNVDFFDLAAGVGIKRYYAADVNSDTKDTVGEYLLTTNTIFSSVGFTKQAGALDIDFDIVLTRNLTIGGECVINIPVKMQNSAGGGGEGTTTYTATVRHWDGSTETDLGSETTLVSLTLPTSDASVATIATIRLDITEKQFRNGDTIRLTIAHTGAAGTANFVSTGHDPQGRITIDAGIGAGIQWTTTATTIDLPIILNQ